MINILKNVNLFLHKSTYKIFFLVIYFNNINTACKAVNINFCFTILNCYLFEQLTLDIVYGNCQYYNYDCYMVIIKKINFSHNGQQTQIPFCY